MVNPLVEWAVEREKIRKAKEAGLPPPWTDDPILQTYRFCNIRRRDDRVSRWLRNNVLRSDNLLATSFGSFVIFTAFCRWNNWPPVIQEILNRGLFPTKEIDWEGVIQVIEDFKAKGQKAWTGAYMIRSDNRIKGASKARFIVSVVRGIEPILPQLEIAFRNEVRREAWLALRTVFSFGDFMAGQCVDDWTWTSYLNSAKDLYTWAPMGPGSIRGFNRMLGRSLNKRPSEEEFCEHLQVWRKEIIEALGPEYEDFDLMSVQNCCCEFDKWSRVKNNQGRPRSKYKPETAYNV